MISTVSPMPFKVSQTGSRSYVNMSWDSSYEAWVAYSRPGPVFEPQLPRISKRWRY
ncbi:hypothetical protein EV11_0128 [Prochlorococcus sp. SS52]|uniref:Uncharacterized protein n=1 Tax=Prochlorococcus marinus (strain SARG / CCMP1375 / SS120) TaxID=167539 RepID=Q7VAH7_PROMA|nr:hypothetical protein [Prochlorococcus marinus]AAQ00529.1 Predicted protein [Prochlorococcus marinus subsp. marinus str. CCMP1375]KGG24234.1 hypothetical protein EV09_0841 [Prochlorococcus marinus str. SS35]KGG37424.1 hypothetical protein EV11_0128 [Prochlorococcus sp. SS52]